jgi:hypothetical protein
VAADNAHDAINALVLKGDTSKLTIEQKTQYYNAVCQTVGLNPATRPFEFLNFQGKEVLYPNKQCAEQLRSIKRISLGGPKISFQENLIMVEITATDSNGRTDTDYGIVDTAGRDKSLSRADQIAKAITKAKRRVTFSICGLGFFNDRPEEGEEVAILQETTALPPANEYLTSDQFEEIKTLSAAMGMSAVELGFYLRQRYPSLTRAEIPATDFDQIFEDLSDEETVGAIKEQYAKVPR